MQENQHGILLLIKIFYKNMVKNKYYLLMVLMAFMVMIILKNFMFQVNQKWHVYLVYLYGMIEFIHLKLLMNFVIIIRYLDTIITESHHAKKLQEGTSENRGMYIYEQNLIADPPPRRKSATPLAQAHKNISRCQGSIE